MYNFLYHFPNFIWAVVGVVLAVFDLINLITYFWGDNDKKEDKKKYFAILTIPAIICFILYPIKNNLVEMPKATPNTYANAIQLLDSYGISYEADSEVNDYTETIVNDQSIKEGKIINKKNAIVILYIENKDDNSSDITTTTQSPETDDSTSHENITASDNENNDTGTSSAEKSSEDELETTTSIPETESISLSLDNNYENEPNNDFPEATPINVNKNIEGILDSKNDEDYYIFNLNQKGKVSISFNHEKFDSSYVYWNFNIYDSNSKRVHTFDIYGNVADTESDSIRLPAGKYYCKINSNSYEYCKYTFNVNFQDEYDNYETEDNNDFPQATPINVNQSYIGNIQDKYDKDYFKFEISQKGNISISFNHEQFDKYYDYWEIHLISDEKTILVFNSAGSTSSLTSDVVRLPVGTYYLKITSNNFNNLDYKFSVNYNDENEYFESEPNNDYKFATIINLDTEYIGNIQSKNDVDFYEINITDDNTNIEFYFMHEITDKNYTYWNVYFLDTNSNGLKFLDDNSKNFSYLSISGRESKTKFYVNDLSCGKYYIKIRAENYKNDDYSFFVSKI